MVSVRAIGTTTLMVFAGFWAIFRVSPAPVPELPNYVQAIGNWTDAQGAQNYAHLRENLVWQWVFGTSATAGVAAYLLQWLLVTTLVIAALAYIYWKNAPRESKGVGLRLAILSPVVALLFGFYGSYDAITALLAIALLVSWSRQSSWFVGLVCVLLGLQHFGQALPMIVALALTWSALKENSLSRQTVRLTVIGLGSATLGKGLGLLLLVIASSSAAGSRVPQGDWFEPLRDAWVTSLNFLPAVLYSFLAGAWVIAAFVFWDGDRRRRTLLIGAWLCCSIPAFSLLDQTRVFVLLSLPALSLVTIHFLQGTNPGKSRIRVVEVTAWVSVPILVWTGYTGVGRVQYMGALDAQIIAWQQIFAWL